MLIYMALIERMAWTDGVIFCACPVNPLDRLIDSQALTTPSPAVVTMLSGLAVGLDPEGYGNPDFCWLSIYDTLIWSFAGPVAFAVSVSARKWAGGEQAA